MQAASLQVLLWNALAMYPPGRPVWAAQGTETSSLHHQLGLRAAGGRHNKDRIIVKYGGAVALQLLRGWLLFCPLEGCDAPPCVELSRGIWKSQPLRYYAHNHHCLFTSYSSIC